jgi:hypothetical protein
MKRLLTILFFIPLFGNTQFTFTPIPYSDTDIVSPGRAPDKWHSGIQEVRYPTSSSVPLNTLDEYYRFEWSNLEGATLGSYTWTYFDGLMNAAIDAGRKLAFGIMPHFSDGGMVSYDGGTSSYPSYLHDLMKVETYPDWKSGNGVWVPNWNSVNYLGRLRALHEALYAHILATSHSGVQYRNAISWIDVRGFGNYGEWHTSDIGNKTSFPAGTWPSVATCKTIIDHHTQVFDLWPLQMMVAAFDGGMTGIPIFIDSSEVAYYALTTSNAWGLLGYRKDQWGAIDNYLKQLLEGNTKTFGGSLPFKDYILNRYKYAPVTGEPMPTNLDMSDLENQVNTYHATSFGNGNWGNGDDPPVSLTVRDRIRAAGKRTGYRYVFTGGSAVVGSSTFRVLLDWKNNGVAPSYENWIVEYKLKNGGGTVVWTETSAFTPTLFTPDQGNVTATDVFTKPVLSDGTYTLFATVKDITGFRDPLPIAITGRDGDGSYELGDVTFPGVGPRPDPEEPPPPVPGEAPRYKWGRKFVSN